MKIAVLALAGSVAFLGTGATPTSAQTKDPAMDKLAADWAAAFAKGDAKALAGFYTENAIRVTPEGGKVVSRGAIEKEFAANFAGPFKGAKITINVGSIQHVSADVAVNEGTYEVTGILKPDGKPAPALRGSYLNTIVKKGAAWIIASNAGILPPPPATK
jgi:uncharacterized protein (TIGR02246 family)